MINVTVKQELLKHIRKKMMFDGIAGVVGREKAREMIKASDQGDLTKHPAAKKHWVTLTAAVQGIDAVIAEYEKVFMYTAGKLKTGALDFLDATALMKTYVLNSSDALILNFGLKVGDIRGLVTCDSDYARVKGEMAADGQPFDIYLPKRHI